MPPYQVNKKYDYMEVVNASNGYFVHESSYSTFNRQQQALLKDIPTWDSFSKFYSGRGIVISAGATHIARVWPTVLLMLKALNCTLPVQIWTMNQDEQDRTTPLADQMRRDLKIDLTVHKLSDYMEIDWSGGIPAIFKVKALALLYSSFEQILLLDADSIPVRDPNVLFDMDEGKTGLIQWPDFWKNSVSKVLYDAYDIDHNMTRTTESGQMLIDKRSQFEPLVLATYFNWYGPLFFHRLIYMDSMGAGDKDTFYVASAAYHRQYHIVERGIESIKVVHANGSQWKIQDNIFNGALGQFMPNSSNEIFAMHVSTLDQGEVRLEAWH
jgi:hypothetical protein